MDNSIELDTNPQLEAILKSIELEDKALLDPILKSNSVDITDKNVIKKYLKLFEISGRPSVPLLNKEIPGRNFEVEPIDKSVLSESIQIFLYNRKNLETSKNLMDLSSKIRAEGLTEEIIGKLSEYTKVDSVQHKFVNIRDTFIERYENADFSVGIPIGIGFIDEMVGGIHKGEITTIFGFAGHCKTTAAVNAAYNALHQKQNVLYCSFEVTKDNIYNDFLSRHSNMNKFRMRIEHYALKKRKLKPDQWKFVKNDLKPDFDNLPGKLYIVDEADFDNYSKFSFEAKFREIDKIAIEETGHGIDVVVIDHVQLLKFGQSMGRSNSTGDVINEYVSWFRQQCMNWLNTERQVAFICLSQANRQGYETAKANNGRYSATALAEANELERASTLILTVYAEAEMKDMGNIRMQILKYRDNRNEDDPTDVNVDLQYYLLGDIEQGASATTSKVSEENVDNLAGILESDYNDNAEEALEAFGDLASGEFDIGIGGI